VSGRGDAGREELAERLARLTEASLQGKPEHASATADGGDGPGVAAIERIIGAFARLRGAPCTGPDGHEGGDGPGFAWGHLQVHDLLGSGSFGEVFRAYDPVLERNVALKLRREGPHSPRGYILEARRLARVRHPNVLAVHGAAVHDGRAGLWCDLIHGQALNAWVAAHGPCDRATVLAAGLALASALDAVHAAGLIHGDVKPGNVMRAEDGRFILMDFGTAVEDDGDGIRALCGSPLAMAPEQIAGARIGSGVDVYALGVVLYFLACGRYPLEAGTLEALRSLHERAAEPDWTPLRARCGRRFAKLVQQLMAREPGQRPSAADARRQLQAIADAPRHRQRRWLLAASFTALGTALVVSLVALRWIQHERDAAARAYQRELAARDFTRRLLDAPRPGTSGAEVRVLDILDDAPAVAEQRFAGDPLALATTLGDLGRSHHAIGEHRTAQPLLRRAATLGAQHGMAAAELLDIRITLAAVDHYLDASPGTREALATLHADSRARLGERHPVTAQAALELAIALDALPGSEVADRVESLLRAIVAQPQAADGASDQQRVTAHNRLADLYAKHGRWAEAEAELAAGMRIAEQALGQESASSLVLRATAAMIASRQGRHAEAEAQLTALLAASERRYGPRHRNLRTVHNNLAISQRMQGKTLDAITHFERALELAREQLGGEHVEVLSIEDNLASALADAGRAGAARGMRERSYATKARVLGPRHPGTLLSALNLAEQYVDDGEARRGLELATTAGDAAVAVFGAEHLFALEAREIAARALLGLGQAQAARDRLLAVLADKRRLLGEGHDYSLRSASFLAAAHAAAGEHRQALELLHPTLRALRARHQDGQPDLVRAERLLEALQ